MDWLENIYTDSLQEPDRRNYSKTTKSKPKTKNKIATIRTNSPYKVVTYYSNRQLVRYHQTLRSATDSARAPAQETKTVFKKVGKTWKGMHRFSHKKLN